MKILPVEKIRQADAYTIQNEPVNSIDLMERAAKACVDYVIKKWEKSQTIKLFCGLGNNGGDGLAIARLLQQNGFNPEVFITSFSDKFSSDFATNLERIKDTTNVAVTWLKQDTPLPGLDENVLAIDCIFGSGLSKSVEGHAADIIKYINQSNAKVLSIDIPSGLFCDQSSLGKDNSVIEADYTLSFQFPKLAFMFPENGRFVGNWEVIPIGLHPDFILSAETQNFFLQKDYCQHIYKLRDKFAHKGSFGHALLISGSYGKMGAAVLSSSACLRAGAGLLTTHIPRKGYEIIQTAIPEAMISIDTSDFFFSEVPDLSPYNAIGIGPGIGMDNQTQNSLKLLIQNSGIPLLFDADAINILGENKTWIPFVPANSIFTPHPKEFERLAGKSNNDFERNHLQREFSIKYGVYVVLKGAHTAITCPDGNCYFNSTGNPGMATAGSGDVLTGIILGLLAQKYTPQQACLLGVFLHGLAGDRAAQKFGQEAMIASDSIRALGKAWKTFLGE